MASSPSYFSRLDLACEESAARWAKEHAKAVLGEWGLPDDALYDALTIVAELSSNAVRHAGSEIHPFVPETGQPRVPTCTLLLWISNGRLCLSMYDESPNPPVLRPASLGSENGRGLQLIAGLSEGDWGYDVSSRRTGKFVWAWLRLPARGARARSLMGDGPHRGPGVQSLAPPAAGGRQRARTA